LQLLFLSGSNQTIAQRWIGSEEAALLYTLEPIFAAKFSYWLLGE
jgi:drug/metabolite transporter (DMT)-like permease